MNRNITFVITVLAGMSLTACVSQKIEPEYIPKVATSQNYKGVVSISWPSRKGYNYRLGVRDKGKVDFDTKTYKGTGEDIVVQFKLNPEIPLPDYVVKPEKIPGY